ncbi:MAG: hypothetical protein ACLFTT_01805 [Candidatus Hydrogenedentota bacterium]
MSVRIPYALLVTLVVALVAGAADAQQRLKTWKLREHYTWDSPHGRLLYFADNAEWCVFAGEAEDSVVLDYVGFEVTLADGTHFTQDDLGDGAAEPERFEGDFGAGRHIEVRFPEREGMVVIHRISILNEYPFMFFQLMLTNKRETPIEVATIKPLVLKPGGIPQRAGEVELELRSINTRGGRPVYSRNDAPIFGLVKIPAHPLTLSLGVLPRGRAQHGIFLDAYEGAWQGTITGEYKPAFALAPGETLEAAPLFVTANTPSEDEVSLYYAWALKSLQPVQLQGHVPIVWASVGEGGGLKELVSNAKAARDVGIAHALVPAGWESLPGSHRGRLPDFPRDAGVIASVLSGAGMKAGVTVDALAVQKLRDKYVVTADDGQSWVKLGDAEAHAAAVNHLRALLREGFDFLAVAPSAVPDAVLRELGHTRAQAEHIAFQLAVEAADGKPVFPTAADILPAETGVWQEAARASNRMGRFALLVAPVQFDADKAGELPAPLVDAMAGWEGPLEVVGRVNGKTKAGLRQVITRQKAAQETRIDG